VAILNAHNYLKYSKRTPIPKCPSDFKGCTPSEVLQFILDEDLSNYLSEFKKI
jgi:hypothetical protein